MFSAGIVKVAGGEVEVMYCKVCGLRKHSYITKKKVKK
jgi:hypothetical protein